MNNHKSCQSHCCIHHGCKYGHEDCPVVTGEVLQDYPCPDCPNLTWEAATASRFEAKVGPETLTLEGVGGGDVWTITFLGKTSEFNGPLAQAKISAAGFAEDLVNEMSEALSPYDAFGY